MISSDIGEESDNSDDDDIQRDSSENSDGGRGGRTAEFSAAHRPLQGSFKTAEGITLTIVKGSVADQKVRMSQRALCLHM